MSQAVRDLPDPLDPSPSLSASDPDDLLSKMADEAIDRLIADADSGRPLSIALPPAVEATPPDTMNDEPDDEPAYPPAVAKAEQVADHRIVAIEEPPAAPANATTANEEPIAGEAAEEHSSEVIDHVTVVDHEVLAEPAADATPLPASDRQALLAEPKWRTSVWLWPLWLLNLPFAWIGENARRAFGLIGIVTLVPAVAAIVYVLWLKQRWGG